MLEAKFGEDPKIIIKITVFYELVDLKLDNWIKKVRLN